MPIYEYRCDKCRKKVSILTLRVSAKVDERCEHCGSTKLTRLASRFAMARSEESRLDSLADPSNLAGLDENDRELRIFRSRRRNSGNHPGV